MFGSDILDVAIGTIFIFLALSLICTIVNEFVASIFALRSMTLKKGVEELLGDATLSTPSTDNGGTEEVRVSDLVLVHPLVMGLAKGIKAPSYLPSDIFVKALLDVIDPSTSRTGPIQNVRSVIGRLPPGQESERLKRSLLMLIDDVSTDLNQAQERIAGWFDASMQRASGWYKRRAQWILLVIGLMLSGLLNANAFVVVESLYRDPTLRDAVVASAGERLAESTPPPGVAESTPPPGERGSAEPNANEKSRTEDEGDISAAENPSSPSDLGVTKADEIAGELEGLSELGLPLGWDKGTWPHGCPWLGATGKKQGCEGWFPVIGGWFIMALALSLGAPFWFDMLNRIINLRFSGTPPPPPSSETTEGDT